MDIVIYTTPDTIEHKKSRYYSEYYWQVNRMPVKLVAGDRIYFGAKKEIWGSFKVERVTDVDIIWKPTTWRWLQPKKKTPVFRGIRYKWWKR